MQIDVLVRTKRRSISLQISPEGNLIVRAPENCSYEKLQSVLKEKENWITIHKQRIKENRALNEEIINYSKILYLGYTYPIIFANKIKEVGIFEKACYIPIKCEIENHKKCKELIKFYKKKGSEIFRDRVVYFANLMQLKPNSVILSNSKRVWGSCDRFANITLNWRLIMLPPDIIDYVVVHELSHILEFNHSEMFWKIVKSILLDFKERRTLLKKGDFLLQLFRK